jgi:hypothetical protein
MKLGSFQLHKWIIGLAVLAIIIFPLGGCMLTNHPPIITSLKAGREIVPTSGKCQIECIASDRDGSELSYEWSASDGNIDGNGTIVTWTAPNSVGTYTITVKVSNDSGGRDVGRITLTVQTNHTPTIESVNVTPKEPGYMKEYSGGYKILKGKSCEIECVASDLDDDKLNYEWTADDGSLSEEGSMITWTAPPKPPKGGEVTITVTVSDSSGGMATKSIVFEVKTCACAL